jgi:hypothetical protein
VASIIERIDLGCDSNPIRVLISLTAPIPRPFGPDWPKGACAIRSSLEATMGDEPFAGTVPIETIV